MTPRILERIALMATTVADPFSLVADATERADPPAGPQVCDASCSKT
jgi:hypothetical protein